MVEEGALRPGPTQGPASEGGERAAERSIGYRQALDLVWDLREGGALIEGSEDDAVRLFVEEFQAASRQFVKRQLTWFRSDPTVSTMFWLVIVAYIDVAKFLRRSLFSVMSNLHRLRNACSRAWFFVVVRAVVVIYTRMRSFVGFLRDPMRSS